ncbi:winged helix DNA-binding domain-containing protein [Alistipes sp. OttesenSCG-928-B03]|nr:winged helix DNA-binding domain-containing protein [Alistipes sp. OttesenSCG-928-B03]
MIETLRTYGHQLADKGFDDAQALVAYMGAVQGQDIDMSKWAVGMRMKQPALSSVREAIDSGRIIRTHILRPTWHLVSADDIRWMLDLCGKRLRSAYMGSWGKHWDVDEKKYSQFRDAATGMLAGTDGLTIQELLAVLNEAGHNWGMEQVKTMLCVGEAEGLVCNGREKGCKHTFALLDERVPATSAITKEEALSLLALKYFRSHSPASLEDFVWWSGLSGTEAKTAIGSIERELITDRYKGLKLFVHESCTRDCRPDDEVHLLPPYDEYLIAYRDRTHVLEPKYTSKAHNNYGIFHPVISYKGRIAGNWKKAAKKGGVEIETTFFTKSAAPGKRKLQAAIDRYTDFLKA